MYQNFKNLHQDERGLSALETAIILIAFIVVGSVFAFTILSAGTFSTERGSEAVYAGLEEVQSSMEVRGSVIVTATSTGSAGTVDSIIVTLATAGGEPVDTGQLRANYRDSTRYEQGLAVSTAFVGTNDSDTLLERGELVEMTIDVSSLNLGTNQEFAIDLQTPAGGGLSVQRTTPGWIDPVMALD